MEEPAAPPPKPWHLLDELLLRSHCQMSEMSVSGLTSGSGMTGMTSHHGSETSGAQEATGGPTTSGWSSGKAAGGPTNSGGDPVWPCLGEWR